MLSQNYSDKDKCNIYLDNSRKPLIYNIGNR